jgi:hypothetical protein
VFRRILSFLFGEKPGPYNKKYKAEFGTFIYRRRFAFPLPVRNIVDLTMPRATIFLQTYVVCRYEWLRFGPFVLHRTAEAWTPEYLEKRFQEKTLEYGTTFFYKVKMRRLAQESD